MEEAEDGGEDASSAASAAAASDTQELERLRKILRAVLDATPDVYFVKNWEHRLLLVSRSLAEAMGTSTQTMEGGLDSDFWPAASCEGDPATGRRGYHDEDRQALEGESFRSDEKVMLADGIEHSFYTDRTPLRDDSGDVFAMLGYARDITDTLLLQERTDELHATLATLEKTVAELQAEIQARKKAESRLQDSNRTLEARVLERTNALQEQIASNAATEAKRRKLEEQLRQAQKLESLGTLAGGIAHDFNNLLTVVTFNLRFLSDAADSSTESVIDEIRRATESAAMLTGQILAFSRKQVLRPATIDLNERIPSTLQLLRRTIGEQYELDFIPGAKLGANFADPGQVDQVLINLCVNARDAMPDGGRITIATENVVVNGEYTRTHAWAKPGRYVLLTVSDTGVGMPPETKARVFEPFFTTKAMGRGTGLGLATVYGIVRQHDGMIQVYSEPGRGTVFKIYLPIVERAAVAVPSVPPLAGPTGREHVLVAEDNPAIRQAIETVLRNAGYRVTVAVDGGAALKLFSEAPTSFDLVVVDVVMPELGGPEVITRMKTQVSQLRCILMSGYAASADELADELAEYRWLNKPFRPEELLLAVRESLDA